MDSVIDKITKYCSGLWKPLKKEEGLFLSSTDLKNTIKTKCSLNTGKLSEWYLKKLLEDKGYKNGNDYISQPRMYFNKKRYIQPDFYLPKKKMFIEIKSRSYNCPGSASEKLDNVVRKYSKLIHIKKYKKSKLLVVCSAHELFNESTIELLNYRHKKTRMYIKDFVELSKKHGVIDWIPITKINEYI